MCVGGHRAQGVCAHSSAMGSLHAAPSPPNQPYFVLAVREPIVPDLDGQVCGEQAVPQGQVAAKQTPVLSPLPWGGRGAPTAQGLRVCAQDPRGSAVAGGESGRLCGGGAGGLTAEHRACR